MMEQFHFMRPFWLLALVVIPFIVWRRQSSSASRSNWSQVVDSHLLAALKVATNEVTSRWPVKPFFALALLLTVFGLAGPTWTKTEQPVFTSDNARVFVLDLSQSMDAADVSPSRLVRAKLKLLDMLNATTEGQVGLVTFAATPFVVSPLTTDAQTVVSLVSALDTNIVPIQGSQADAALQKAHELLVQAQVSQGDIVLITDEVNEAAHAVAAELSAKGVRLHVLAVGTAEGAPVPLPGGSFLKDQNGAIVIPKVDESDLRSLATQGGGLYRLAGTDDSDTKLIMSAARSPSIDRRTQNENSALTERWQDRGYWLAIFALPLVAMLFRRGVLALLLATTLSGHSTNSWAMEWSDLWQRKDQQAAELLQQGDAAKAAQTFSDPQWKGTAYYKAGDYENAQKQFSQSSTVDAQYNAATALAKMGRLEEALHAYDDVLKKDADHVDAKFNRDLIEKFLKQQQQSKQDQNSSSKKDDASKNPSSEQNQKSEKNDNQGEQQKGDGKENNTKSPQDSPGKDSKDRKASEHAQPSNDKDNKDGKTEKQTQNSDDENKNDDKKNAETHAVDEKTPVEKEQAQAVQQWLRRIPDDPGGLLREKYRRQMMKDQHALDQEKKW